MSNMEVRVFLLPIWRPAAQGGLAKSANQDKFITLFTFLA